MNQNFCFPEKHIPGHSKEFINHHSEAEDTGVQGGGRQSDSLIRILGLLLPSHQHPDGPSMAKSRSVQGQHARSILTKYLLLTQ